MGSETSTVPYLWRRGLASVRGALAGVCLILVLVYDRRSPAGLIGLAVLFALYSLSAFFWRTLERTGFMVLMLCIDTVFFFLCATYSPVGAVWLVALFYLFVLLHASILHGWREVILVAGMTAAFLFLTSPPAVAVLGPATLLSSVLATVLAAQKKALEGRLSNASRQVVHFRSEAEKAREAERQRIAADFHDGPLQSFMSFQIRLEVLRRLLERDTERGKQELAQMQEFCRAQVGELRSFIRGMRPVEVDAGSLGASVRRMVESFQKDTGISATFVAGEFQDPAESETCLEVLQVVREALHNVQKHSRASRVAVAMQRADGYLEISVDDDGAGFPFSGSYTLEELELLRQGPGSIKRRVRSLSGELSVESHPGRGAALKIRIPT